MFWAWPIIEDEDFRNGSSHDDIALVVILEIDCILILEHTNTTHLHQARCTCDYTLKTREDAT
jgi:hypothetical protein